MPLSAVDAQVAESGGANSAVAAPAFDPQSKAAHRQPPGIKGFNRIYRGVNLPVFALRGVTRQDAGECIAADTAGIAGITLYRG